MATSSHEVADLNRALELCSTPDVAEQVFRSLLVLQTQIDGLRTHGHQLEAVREVDDEAAAHMVHLGVWQTLGRIAHAYFQVRRHVVAFDRAVLGSVVESFGELLLRGQMFVVAVQLSRLASAICVSPTAGLMSNSIGNDLIAIAELDELARVEFELANGQWLPHRKVANSSPASIPTEHHRARCYREGIRAAGHRLNAMLLWPSIERLQRVAARPSTPHEIQSACSLIAAALEIRISSDIDLAWASRAKTASRI